ncbi:MAG: Spy/CpxP family protein refolding chaperone [Ignavibacteriaceae bacterium]|nr:Spy/CpxP family protein refolding chaperone [Ignavibacteriaceae bacterium]
MMKTLALSIITVILFTFCTVGTGNAQQNPDKGHASGKGMKGMMAHKDDMMKKLNLSDQQKDKIADLKTSFQKNMVDLRSDLKKNQIDLKSLRSKDNITREDLIASVDKVNKSKNAIALAFANHIFDVYQVLTPEQQKTWKENAKGKNFHGKRGHFGFDSEDRF